MMTTTMTHAERIDAMLSKTEGKAFEKNQWGGRHCAAWRLPRAPERGIVRLIQAAAIYADDHHAQYESNIGDDGALSGYFADILRAVLGLLCGDLGRLDGGTVDGLIREMLAAEGLSDE